MSKERIASLGEVFTPEFIVKDMLKNIKDMNYSTSFFEPGCGDGNFVKEILEIKLHHLNSLKEVKKSLSSGYFDELEHKLVILIGSIYAVEIDKSNRNKTVERLFETIKKYYKSKGGDNINFLEIIYEIINKNIILADLLKDIENIQIYEYAELPGYKIKLKIFNFNDLLYPDDEVFRDDLKLFGHVPKAIKEYNSTHYRNIITLLNE